MYTLYTRIVKKKKTHGRSILNYYNTRIYIHDTPGVWKNWENR